MFCTSISKNYVLIFNFSITKNSWRVLVLTDFYFHYDRQTVKRDLQELTAVCFFVRRFHAFQMVVRNFKDTPVRSRSALLACRLADKSRWACLLAHWTSAGISSDAGPRLPKHPATLERCHDNSQRVVSRILRRAAVWDTMTDNWPFYVSTFHFINKNHNWMFWILKITRTEWKRAYLWQEDARS
jgi:hypothetical protein